MLAQRSAVWWHQGDDGIQIAPGAVGDGFIDGIVEGEVLR